jgi:ABC-type transport system substrate-binding protein
MTLRLHLQLGRATKRSAPYSEQLSRREALRRASLLGLGASTMAGLLTAAPAGQAVALAAAQDETPRRGGSLRVAVPGSAETFDPNVAFVFEAIWACELLYSSLIRFTPDLQLEPELALSWEPNDTLDQWTFALREGVK